MRIIEAPEEYIENDGDIKVFLAGGISNCRDWQREVIGALRTIDKVDNLDRLVIFNPRREVFDINCSDEEVKSQIEWEFNMLECSDIFSMYFCNSESVQPICMYELGRNLYKIFNEYEFFKNHLVISVEDGYKREFDVKVQSELALGEDIVNLNSDTLSHAKFIYDKYKCLM